MQPQTTTEADRYVPEHLERWTADGPTAFDSAANYCGGDFSDFYLAPVSITRDTQDSVTLSNWGVLTAELDSVSEHDETGEHTFNHWACGWYSLYLIHADDVAALKLADGAACSLADYPILDEEKCSELETEQAEEDYSNWGQREWESILTDALAEYIPQDSNIDAEDVIWELSSEKKDALFWEILGSLNWGTEHDSEGTRFNFKGLRDALTIDDLRDLTGLPLLSPDQEWRREPYPWPDGSSDPLVPPFPGSADV